MESAAMTRMTPHLGIPHLQRGMTLMELMLASALGFVVIMAMGKVDLTRSSIGREVHTTALLQSNAWRAVFHMTKRLAEADRINLVFAGGPVPALASIQLRIPEPDTGGPGCAVASCTGSTPAPCCFDIAANYRWAQYHFDLGTYTIRFFNNTQAGCGDVRVLAHYVSSVGIDYQDAEPLAPPGGEPTGPNLGGGEDNNVIGLELRMRHPITGETVLASDWVTTNASYGATTGLADPTVSSPPPLCP